MKTIKKSTLHELTKITREYIKNPAADPMQDRIIDVSRALAKQAYDIMYAWTSFYDIAIAILGWYPLKPDCTDEEFEELFKWLGFEIEEDDDCPLNNI